MINYYGLISHQGTVLYHFHADDSLQAFAKLALLIETTYPAAHGELIDLSTGDVVYECHRDAIC